jgi:hypothetical protein
MCGWHFPENVISILFPQNYLSEERNARNIMHVHFLLGIVLDILYQNMREYQTQAVLWVTCEAQNYTLYINKSIP